MELPQTNQETLPGATREPAIKTPLLIGLGALVVLALISFFFVTLYLDGVGGSRRAEAAAAATPEDAFADVRLEGKAAIVYDLSTKQVLFEKNADTQLPLASITKVMLVLAVIEGLPTETVITIPYDTSPKGSAERLGKGEHWKVQDVINFTLIASSNGGADILAGAANARLHERYPASPLESATLWRMNELAQDLGMLHTYFLNDNGLDVSATQAGAYSSARDVAIMMAYAATSSPVVFAATAEDGILLYDEAGAKTAAFNTNEALGDIPGLVMGKTGFTDLAGGNLAIVFDIGLAHPVVAVILNSSHDGRFSDMKTLVTRARKAVIQN